jgi:hypothetical protein
MPEDALPEALSQLHALQQGFAALQAGDLGASGFCRQARGLAQLRQALPPRYGEVLDQLLDRLESSALFTEDSCSFSQSDLRDSLGLWLDKARARLA